MTKLISSFARRTIHVRIPHPYTQSEHLGSVGTMAAGAGRPSRTVLVTGAAGGLGSVMVRALVSDGHRVAAVDADGAALRRLIESLGGPPGLHAMTHDLAEPNACREVVRATVATFGTLHAVINNAGIGSRHVPATRVQSQPALDEIPCAAWDRFFAINTRAPMLLCQGALRYMRAAQWGRIVNVTTSFRSMLNALPYGASKAALESMSAVWASQLGEFGIGVNVLVPGGPTDTGFVPDIGMARGSMLRPEIMAAPISWLMSDDSDGFHGRRITAARWPEGGVGVAAVIAASRPIGWPELASEAIWGRAPTTAKDGGAAT